MQRPATSDVSDLSLSDTDDEPRDVPKNINLKSLQRAGDSSIPQVRIIDILLFLDAELLSQQYRTRRKNKFDKKLATDKETDQSRFLKIPIIWFSNGRDLRWPILQMLS
jgi:hypothetical protein